VHSVRSASLVMNLIDELPDSKNKYIFHWFSGSSSELKRAISLGSYFSVNSGMLKSAKGRGLVTEIPRDRILTETDGPFTFTDQGSPFTPKELDLVINKLCELLQIAHGELIEKINKNLEFLLQE
ncbi:MAG: TatD family deoxyribonuclease, partial [Bacteroidetes bacterium]